MHLTGKTALVTGGSSGLGEAITRRFVAEGAYVFIADIDEDAGNALAGDLGSTAMFLPLDVTREEAWHAAADVISQAVDQLDILVNNAGITTLGSIEDLSLDEFRHEIDVDMIGVFLGCKLMLPLLKKSDSGSIINMSSMCGIRAQASLVGYNAVKAAVTHMTKSVALHCAEKKYGVRCNSIHPGLIKTAMVEKVLAQGRDAEALFASWVAEHPVGRLGEPSEIAAVALYLAGDESRFTTGSEFRIDGGSSL